MILSADSESLFVDREILHDDLWNIIEIVEKIDLIILTLHLHPVTSVSPFCLTNLFTV